MADHGLPRPPAAQGTYVPAVVYGNLVLSAGMTPRVEGALAYVGRVGREVSVEEGRVAAGIAVANAVSAMQHVLGSIDAVERCVRLTVFVAADSDFAEHSAVADGASARLMQIFGERGHAVRSAIGVSSLPGNACVEVELTCGVAGVGASPERGDASS